MTGNKTVAKPTNFKKAKEAGVLRTPTGPVKAKHLFNDGSNAVYRIDIALRARGIDPVAEAAKAALDNVK